MYNIPLTLRITLNANDDVFMIIIFFLFIFLSTNFLSLSLSFFLSHSLSFLLINSIILLDKAWWKKNDFVKQKHKFLIGFFQAENFLRFLLFVVEKIEFSKMKKKKLENFKFTIKQICLKIEKSSQTIKCNSK